MVIAASRAESHAQDQTDQREEHNKTYHEAQDRMRFLPNYYRWIYSTFQTHLSGTVVELGVGLGVGIENYKQAASQIICADYNEVLLESLKARYPESKVQTRLVDLKGEWQEFAGVAADAVLALDVMEHFEDDQRFARKIREVLKPGGKAIIKVPAQQKLFSEIDVASGHYRRYEPEQLAELITKAGYRVVSQRYTNPLAAWLYRLKKNNQKNFSKTFSPMTLRLANLIVPALARLDRVQSLRGLSLVGVYERV